MPPPHRSVPSLCPPSLYLLPFCLHRTFLGLPTYLLTLSTFYHPVITLYDVAQPAHLLFPEGAPSFPPVCLCSRSSLCLKCPSSTPYPSKPSVSKPCTHSFIHPSIHFFIQKNPLSLTLCQAPCSFLGHQRWGECSIKKGTEARRGRGGGNDLPEPRLVLGDAGVVEEVGKDQITKGLKCQAVESEVYHDKECGLPKGF